MNKPNLAANELTQTVSLYEQDGRILEANIGKLWLAASLVGSNQVVPALSRLKEFIAATSELKDSALLFIAASQVRIYFEKFNLPPDIFDSMQRIFNRAEQFTRSIPAIRRKLRHISKSAFISPPHLVIHAFGHAQVSLSGRTISISDWQTRETRDLFFFFLQSSPQTKEELAEIFWPDISPPRLKMRFKTNIYRLRHAIGQNTILFEGERYFFNHNIDYEYDVENFNKFLEQANSATKSSDSKVFLQAAIDIVTGPYLADVDSDWAAVKRIRIELQYHAALIRLAGLYLDDNQAVEALEVCQTALKNDPLMEEAYRLSMRAYAILGDGSAVARVFQTCIKILDDELGVKPSRETEKLYQKVI
jgi:two-component SAPR family response regulator